MAIAPIDARAHRVPWRTDARLVAWWLTLGAAVGGLAGVVFGGLGGRLLMMVLRLNSPGASGLTSDDGFEIGRVTLASVNLAAFGAAAGAVFGALYVLLRCGVPAMARVPLATLLGGAVGGTTFLRPEGIDLAVLDPLGLAVAGFIALPALSAMATAALVERWSGLAPWSITRRRALAFAPALLGVFVAPLLALGAAGVVVARRPRRSAWLTRAARPTVTALLLVIVAAQTVALVREVDRVL